MGGLPVSVHKDFVSPFFRILYWASVSVLLAALQAGRGFS